MHRWFPWIEGFSSELPELAISAEHPRSIYDPFLGSGTTAVVATQMGIDAAGAEVNPFLRFVTRVKTSVAAKLAVEPRAEVEARFEKLLQSAESSEPDGSLLNGLFHDADYFEKVALADITRVKAAVEMSSQLAVDRDLALLALARVLVESSNMIRRADLRRRRANETNGQGKKVLPRFRATIQMMLADLDYVASANGGSLGAVVSDARLAPGAGDPVYDLCITSPPYLNGTNYVRNTKIEMWVLDLISETRELRELRDSVVTAGINDVRLKVARPTFDDGRISKVLAELDEDAYDRRIPMMVASYLRDMRQVFQATSMRIRPGGAMYLDIGDSRFSGVHVPTDELLVAVAEDAGLDLVDSFKIRDRRSKDGSPLTQKMLIFKTPSPRRMRPKASGATRRLAGLVADRPFAESPYSARNWGHPWHSMCSYQAKLKPSIGHFLVKEFSALGDCVLDPFSGAGTIPLEACLQGRKGWGNDIGPLANQLTAAKTSRPNPTAVRRRMSQLLDQVEVDGSASGTPAIGEWGMNGPVREYFHPSTLKEIVAARGWLQEAPMDPTTALIWSAVAHILHGNRPYALSRRSHPITPFAPSGPNDHRPLRPRLEAKVEKLLAAELGPDWTDGLATRSDVLSLGVPAGRADVIITSPPFAGSTRFHTNNWLRTWFCGWEPADFEDRRQFFLEYRQARNFSVYEGVFSSLHRVIRPDGLAIWHLGKSKRFDMAQALAKLADPWFKTEGTYEEDVSAVQSHGISDQGTTHTHQFVLMRSR